MTDQKTVLAYLAFGLLMLAAGASIGGIYGRSTASENIIIISKNGTLEAYDMIQLTNQLPDDLAEVTKRTDKHRIVFLWTDGGSTHRYLYVMVLDK